MAVFTIFEILPNKKRKKEKRLLNFEKNTFG
jgi:hypothetical protein